MIAAAALFGAFLGAVYAAIGLGGAARYLIECADAGCPWGRRRLLAELLFWPAIALRGPDGRGAGGQADD